MTASRYAAITMLLMGTLFAKGQINTDSLLRIVQGDRRDSTEARALNALGNDVARKDLQKAKTYLLLSVQICRDGHFPRQLSNAYGQLTQVYQDLGHSDSSLLYLKLLKKMIDTMPSRREYYLQNAGLYYKKQGKYKEALPYQLEAAELSRADMKRDSSVTNRTDLAGQLLNVGNSYIVLGKPQMALQYYLDGLRLFEEVGNKKGISFCYQMIGTNFLNLRQLKSAMQYTRQSLALKTELQDRRGMGTSLHQIGAIYWNQKSMDSALAYCRQALVIFQQMGLKKDELDIDLDMSAMYGDMQQKDSVRKYLERGRLLAQEVGDTGRVATFNAGLASLQTGVREDKAMEKKLTETLRRSIEIGDGDAELANYRWLADYYANAGQGKLAEEYIKRYYVKNDSFSNIRIQAQLKKMESQYNMDKKEQEISLLKKDQQLAHLDLEKQKLLLQRQRAFQYGSLVVILLLVLIGWLVINRYRIVHRARRAIEIEKMRNNIARDLHDDVGSTLTSINIMSKVALQTPGRQDEAQQATFQKIKDRTSAIIEKMDDIVWTIHPQNDSMERLLFRMKEFAAEMLEPLGINYEFDEKGDLLSLKLDVQKRKDLYLLFKEAVNNAAKYSECHNLRIRLWREKDSLQMEIRDDGRGFMETDIQSGHGLGSMRERAASMVAEIRIDSVIGEGTRIALDMPLA